jgi:hypothetical protein
MWGGDTSAGFEGWAPSTCLLKARQLNAPHPPPPLRKGEGEKRAGDLAAVSDGEGFQHLLIVIVLQDENVVAPWSVVTQLNT